MESDAVRLGKNLKRLREKKNLSQGRIAKMLGVGRSFITNIEHGKTNPTLKTISKLARVLGVSAEKLLG
jgi:transcriptional regulator with XRE-family HTH domain